jgi:hypothetical protein
VVDWLSNTFKRRVVWSDQVLRSSEGQLSADSHPAKEQSPDHTVVFSVTKKSREGMLRYFCLYCFCRIVRAFLIEEVKLMKKLLQQKDKTGKKKKSKGKKAKK